MQAEVVAGLFLYMDFKIPRNYNRNCGKVMWRKLKMLATFEYYRN
jgi:hypothetical protein